ncbi:MAG: EamA family transporter [Desulfobaccales bacterium]
MNWLGFSLMAAGFWGLWGFLSKVATLQLPAAAVYLISVVGYLAITGYLAATQGVAIPYHPGGLAAALGAGICLGLGLLYFFKAMTAGAAANVVVPLTALYPLVTVILSCTLLGEGFSLRQIAGVALALVAVWLIST